MSNAKRPGYDPINPWYFGFNLSSTKPNWYSRILRNHLWKLPCSSSIVESQTVWRTNPVHLFFPPVLHISHATYITGNWLLSPPPVKVSNHARRYLPDNLTRFRDYVGVHAANQVRQRTSSTQTQNCDPLVVVGCDKITWGMDVCQHQLNTTLEFSFEILSITITTRRWCCLCFGTFWWTWRKWGMELRCASPSHPIRKQQWGVWPLPVYSGTRLYQKETTFPLISA